MNNDYTKPSRMKRRLKHRWKKKPPSIFTYRPTLNESIKLTSTLLAAKMSMLSQKTKVWSRNQNIGHNRPLLNVVFLCPPKTQAALRLVCSIMAGLFGQRSALAGSYAGFRPHLDPSPNTVESIGGGYPLYIGIPQ